MHIAESDNFFAESHPDPEVSRTDGGHLRINPKVKVTDRTELSPELIKEMALLTVVIGKAMKAGLDERGINIGRINYQDNGNWRHDLHVHLYGRSPQATYNIYGEPVKSARIKAKKIPQEPLTAEDCAVIRAKALAYAKEPGFENIHLR